MKQPSEAERVFDARVKQVLETLSAEFPADTSGVILVAIDRKHMFVTCASTIAPLATVLLLEKFISELKAGTQTRAPMRPNVPPIPGSH